jgi:hypothetical protein
VCTEVTDLALLLQCREFAELVVRGHRRVDPVGKRTRNSVS